MGVFHLDFYILLPRTHRKWSRDATEVSWRILTADLLRAQFVALVDPREMKRFYYVLDAIGTLSLLPDIIKSWNMSGVTIARAARVARAGTRSVRMVRIFRIMRMVRVVRVFKLMKFVNKASGKLANSTVEGGEEGDAAERGSVARKHAEIVESRVVIGVILLILSLSNLSYESVDNSAYSGLEILAKTFETSRRNNETNSRSTWYLAGEVYSGQIDSLVYLGFGKPDTEYCNTVDSSKIRRRIKYCPYNVTVTNDIRGVAIKENIYEILSNDDQVATRFDLTSEVKERAVYDILLTLFLMVLFTMGSFIFNRDAVKHIVQPLSRMSNQISQMAVTIFGMPESHVVNANSKVLQVVLGNVARMFHTDNLKITTLYTSSQFASEVWTVSVGKEKEESLRGGGTSHRMDLHSISTLASSSNHTPAKTKQIRNFRFRDFMNDPMALKHFGSFLEEKKPDMHSALQFWEDAQRYKKTMSNNVIQAERLARTYVDEADTSLPCLSDEDKNEVRQKVFWQPPTIESFDQTVRKVEDILRDECFEEFIEDQEAFEKFKKSKTELDKCILFENEYAKAAKQEDPHYLRHRLSKYNSTPGFG